MVTWTEAKEFQVEANPIQQKFRNVGYIVRSLPAQFNEEYIKSRKFEAQPDYEFTYIVQAILDEEHKDYLADTSNNNKIHPKGVYTNRSETKQEALNWLEALSKELL